MKKILPIGLLILAMMSFAPLKIKVAETSFWVNHDCGMCKTRILQAVDLKGVKNAEYNEDTSILTVFYNPSKISPEKMQEAIALAGYDNAGMKAPDDAYNKLPGCCQYNRKAMPGH